MILILKLYFNNNMLDNNQEVWGMDVSKLVVFSCSHWDFPWPDSGILHTLLIFFSTFLKVSN